MFQNLSLFKLPNGFRGRSAFRTQLWWLVQAALFRPSPQIAYAFRRWLLRCFGARVGENVLIRPSATITYPWKLSLGDHVWIGDDVVLYTLGEIDIGAHAVISQRSYLCAADHDYRQVDFSIRARPIRIGEQAWVAADVFIGPGVHIDVGAVIGARSAVFKNMPRGMVCMGTPAAPVKKRQTTTTIEESTQGVVHADHQWR
jgi:putative colanic acid biosynthesis acetyltransferase WcaF